MRLTRQAALVPALVALALACACYAAFTSPLGADYPGPACKGCDYAGPAVDALAAGDLREFFAVQPPMGSVTLVLRAPVVAVADAAGAGPLLKYQLGTLACLLLAAALIALILRLTRPQGTRQWLLAAGLLALVLAGPLTTRALFWGHPEEPVGVLLCIAAIVLASRNRGLGAGIALGLALATKQWALLAVVPAICLTAPGQRVKLLAVAAATAAVFMLPMLAGDPGRFVGQNLGAGTGGQHGEYVGVTPTNIWFAYGINDGERLDGGGSTYVIDSSIAALSHPLVLLVGFGLPLLLWRLKRRPTTDDVLLVLALAFLLRCLLDPLSASYHHVPFLVTIAAHEALRRRGLPIVTACSAITLWLLVRSIAPAGDAVVMNRVYLAWALSVGTYMAFTAFRKRGPAPAEAPKPAEAAAVSLS
jgi:hypothetical protein